MKSEKFMRRRIAAGILAVMTAVTPALPVQVAAQGLVGIGTGKQDDIQTEEKGGMKIVSFLGTLFPSLFRFFFLSCE